MAFVQIIEFRTSDIEGARQIGEEWRRATEGKRSVRRELLARDHSDPAATSLSCSSTRMSRRWRTPACRKPRPQRSST
jgi:hypothetical protein